MSCPPFTKIKKKLKNKNKKIINFVKSEKKKI